ncbi:MAG: hypothetical protein OEM67_05880 [Thermoleophilia bacterium]|nr:hypothetical protein [Thermoleophilia bacterium]MDH3725605.1 hypothetical protein [Thermoleophilia bacterium]
MGADAKQKAMERAVSDYLAVSRNRDSFASVEEYEQAEDRAWQSIAAAIEDLGRGDAHGIIGPVLERR